MFQNTTNSSHQTDSKTIKVAIAELSHGHIWWIFERPDKTDIEIIGIYEKNISLQNQFIKKYNLDPKLFFTNLNQMLEEVKPEAVFAFGSIKEHVEIVRACAPKKVHVMVEKPLATNYKDALEIQQLAETHHIQVLTNFETSWYASNQYIKTLVDKEKLGTIRKVMVNDGNKGPKEIGVSDEFFDFITDPVLNGGGALIDFGCYGANLMTWLLKGEKPRSVTAVLNQNKPEIYSKVEDEATIILQYPSLQCVIQGSWNWPFNRKDMEVYGTKGYAIAVNPTLVREKLDELTTEKTLELESRPDPFTDPFSVMAEVVSGRLTLDQYDQYGLAVNVTVVEILDAAKRASQEGKTILFS
jgi:predicted dehydrogenase